MLDMSRTCYPGKIVSFDAEAQTATVKMAMERYHSNMEYYYKKVDREDIDDVPVHFMQCKEFALTMPIMAGDDCLIWFAHRGYDHWLYEGNMEAGTDSRGFPKPQLMRVNDQSDAFVTVGFNPVVRSIQGFNMGALELRSKTGAQKIALNTGGSIDIHNPDSPVNVNCSVMTVNATSKIVLNTPTVEITGDVIGEKTATFTDTVTAADFIMGGMMAMAGAAAKKLSELIQFYTGHTHNYTDDGAPMITQPQNDA